MWKAARFSPPETESGPATMQVTDELIRSVVQEVLSHVQSGQPRSNGKARAHGIFTGVDEAVAAASLAQRQFEKRGLDQRKQAVACIRKICGEQADQLGRDELEETKIGPLPHKTDTPTPITN